MYSALSLGNTIRFFIHLFVLWCFLCGCQLVLRASHCTFDLYNSGCQAALFAWEKACSVCTWALALAFGRDIASSTLSSFFPFPFPSPSSSFPPPAPPSPPLPLTSDLPLGPPDATSLSTPYVMQLLTTPGMLTILAWLLKRVQH